MNEFGAKGAAHDRLTRMACAIRSLHYSAVVIRGT